MEKKLKPCPFCGKKPFFVECYHSGLSEYEETIEIKCANIDCKINPSTKEIRSFKWVDGPPHGYIRIDHGERAVEFWNTRCGD